MKPNQSQNRRKFIRNSGLVAAGAILPVSTGLLTAAETYAPDTPFKLDPLPYAYDALEPHIDTRTMEIHYSKHHQGYVDKLNAAVEKHPELRGKSIKDLLSGINTLPEGARNPVRNMGGGHWNHTFFWKSLARSSEMPSGKLKEAMTSQWQTFEGFKEQFKLQGLGLFGSGWVWMIADGNGKLSITTTPNQDNPLMDVVKEKGKPVMGIDVWEHAYYLKHQNKRADYLDAIWNVINWKSAMESYG